MTDKVLLEAYDVENKFYVRDGVILSHGPYYGEKRFIPHFVERAIKHDATRSERDPRGVGPDWSICSIRAEEVEEYPELSKYTHVGVRRQGGAFCSWLFGHTANR